MSSKSWERTIHCATCKGYHFGVGGAAGIVLVRRDATKPHRPATHVVLQQRSFSTAEGGTWALPGGVLNRGETPREGAIREASEEAGLPRDCTKGVYPLIIVKHEQAFFDHGTWQYTTVIANVMKAFEPIVPQGDNESLQVKWVALHEVEALPLHPSFSEAWPEIRSILGA